MDLLEIFQFTTFAGRQSVLEVFSSDGRQGQVFIDKGDVKHAVCDELQGEEALYECLGFESGSFVSHPWSEPEVITIGKPGDFMLMEAARRRDEARAVTQRLVDWNRG